MSRIEFLSGDKFYPPFFALPPFGGVGLSEPLLFVTCAGVDGSGRIGFGLRTGPLGSACGFGCFSSGILYLPGDIHVNGTSEIPVENKFGYEIVIAEMKYLLEQQYQGIAATKSTAQHILSAASLIIALIGALQLLNVQVDAKWTIPYCGLVIFSILFYVALMICCVLVIRPAQVYTPTSANWDELYEKFVGNQDDLDILKQQLANYLNVLRLNESIVTTRRKLATAASILLPIIVIILFTLSVIPRSLTLSQ